MQRLFVRTVAAVLIPALIGDPMLGAPSRKASSAFERQAIVEPSGSFTWPRMTRAPLILLVIAGTLAAQSGLKIGAQSNRFTIEAKDAPTQDRITADLRGLIREISKWQHNLNQLALLHIPTDTLPGELDNNTPPEILAVVVDHWTIEENIRHYLAELHDRARMSGEDVKKKVKELAAKEKIKLPDIPIWLLGGKKQWKLPPVTPEPATGNAPVYPPTSILLRMPTLVQRLQALELQAA